jgi:hypothetical protein
MDVPHFCEKAREPRAVHGDEWPMGVRGVRSQAFELYQALLQKTPFGRRAEKSPPTGRGSSSTDAGKTEKCLYR